MSAAGRPNMPMEAETPYRPVSAWAVAALMVAVAATAAVLLQAWASQASGKPSVIPALLLPAAIGWAFATIAAWQIRSSEGSRTGLGLATAAWWLSVLSGLGYGAFMVATELALRNQAREFADRVFSRFVNDPLEQAFYLLLDPVTRQTIDESDIGGIRNRFASAIANVRENELVRTVRRAEKRVQVEFQGIKSWTYTTNGFIVELNYLVRTPEGRFDVVATVQGNDLKDIPGRQWHVLFNRTGIVNKQLTAFGRLYLDLSDESRKFLINWVTMLNYGKMRDAFLLTLPAADRKKLEGEANPPGLEQFKAGGIVRFEGQPLTDEQRKVYGLMFAQPNTVNFEPGTVTNPTAAPIITITPEAVRISHRMDLRPSPSLSVPALLTVELISDDLVKALNKLVGPGWENEAVGPPPRNFVATEILKYPHSFRVIDLDIKPSLPKPPGPAPVGPV